MAAQRKAEYWVGFDLGGTKMLAKVLDASYREVARVKKKTRAYEGAETGLERIEGVIRAALAKAGGDGAAPAAIGVGCPGPVDLERGVLPALPNLGWREVPLRDALAEAFGCPVTVVNDVDAGVYGEYRFGAGRGARCVLGVFPGTGIGGGCVYEGRILHGARMSGLEIGHMQVVPEGPLCGCGRRGCLEAVAGRRAIAAAAATAAFRGEAPHLQEAAGFDLAKIRSGTLAASVKAGDAAVEAIVRAAAEWIGVAVGNAVNLLLPDVVVLGGGLVEALPKLFRDTIARTAEARVMPAFAGTFDVRVAALGDDASVTGAAAWARVEAETER
ncbi:MAG: ROK family protein [Lentisphaerae bacterium]|nr:ROK family protein [Lentisphaerota bacterium]